MTRKVLAPTRDVVVAQEAMEEHAFCVMAGKQGQPRLYPNYRTMLVNDSYLVSLFCRQGKLSHSHCKDPAQISHCENQSEASLAGSHWLQTQKLLMVMLKHTPLKLILTNPALLG